MIHSRGRESNCFDDSLGRLVQCGAGSICERTDCTLHYRNDGGEVTPEAARWEGDFCGSAIPDASTLLITLERLYD